MEKFCEPTSQEGGSKGADDLRAHVQSASKRNTKFEPPQGVSDYSSAEELGVRRSSRQNKSTEPERFGDPVKHSIKEVSEGLTGGAFLKAALQE